MRGLIVIGMLAMAGCLTVAPTESSETLAEPAPTSAGPGGAPGGGTDTSVQAQPTPTGVQFVAEGQILAEAAYWGYSSALGLGIRAMDVSVPATATALRVRVEWNDTVMDLDAELHGPRTGLTSPQADDPTSRCFPLSMSGEAVWCNANGSLGAPDSPSTLEVKGEDLAGLLDGRCEPAANPDWGETCNTFAVGIRVKELAANVSWRVIVDVDLLNDE